MMGKGRKTKCLRCGECCFAFDVPELQKPSHEWCRHFSRDADVGICNIYNNRPKSCRVFILPAGKGGSCVLGAYIMQMKRREEE